MLNRGSIAGRSLKRLTNCLAGLFAVCICLLPAPTSAVRSETLSAYPGQTDLTDGHTWFRYHLSRGQTKVDALTVVNGSNQTKEVTLYPVDTIATSDGQLAMRNQGEPRREIGRWIRLSAARLILGPDEHRNVGFELGIPRDAPIGDHVGGIIVQENTLRSLTTAQGLHLQIVSRLAVRVYETIPGRQILVLKLKYYHLTANNRLAVILSLANGGNTTVVPSGHVIVRDWRGTRRERLALPPVVILPHRNIRVMLQSALRRPLIGHYQAQLELNYGQQRLSREVSITWYDPARVLFIAFLGLITGLLIYRRRKKKCRRSII
jgi:hypothetical protein